MKYGVFSLCTCISTCKNINKFVISTSRSFMNNFSLADSFLRFIESQNDFKEVIIRFQKYVYFPRYSGVCTLQLWDIYKKQKVAKPLYKYKKWYTLQKSRKFALRFFSQKTIHFTLHDFSWNFWDWPLYISKKHDSLRLVTFYTQTI